MPDFVKLYECLFNYKFYYFCRVGFVLLCRVNMMFEVEMFLSVRQILNEIQVGTARLLDEFCEAYFF